MTIQDMFFDRPDLLSGSSSGKHVSSMQPTAGISSGRPFHGVGYIEPNQFYLTTPTVADVSQFADWHNTKKNFFFAPYNNAVGEGFNPFAVASVVLLGDKRTYTLAVRRVDTDSFMGAIRLQKVRDTDTVELSYFFDPDDQNKGLGTQSVLRAIHWVAKERGGRQVLGKVRKIIASVAPTNSPSFKILKRAGLKVAEDGFLTQAETLYLDKDGKPETRILMSGRVPADIVPALQAAMNGGYYSLRTLIS
jgi:RimJ/RimL family protein N-acetyltransferase